MLPTNVMSFMKKMVTQEPGTPSAGDPGGDSGALSKLRQTLSSSLMTAQDKVTKLTPAGRVIEPMTGDVFDISIPPKQPEETAPTTPPKPQAKPDGKPPCRSGACRVCLKSFKPDDYSRMCFECHQKVCEDCASYSKLDENQDESTWRCSVCRRKMQSRAQQPVLAQNSTDSMLDVPMMEALTRRHSDAKIGGSASGGGAGGAGGSGLAPPRSPELRRHSDVSPASLKELEKVAGERREELRWERELEWRQKRGSVNVGAADRGGGQSPTTERRPLQPQQPDNWGKTGDGGGDIDDSQEETWRRSGTAREPRASMATPAQMSRAASRRKSRVQKQHSYDDEIKAAGGAASASAAASASSGMQQADVGLGLPVQLPRRASAYDVYATRTSDALTGRDGSPAVERRRSSFRVPAPDPDDQTGLPHTAESNQVPSSSLVIDEDRRSRRRGSQLPDISALRAARSDGARASIAVPRAPEEHTADPIRRQQSVQDGEAIKIVIHDVDFDANLSSRTGSKRRVTLRRDPADKAHRTRGFGMRVVGGKAGADGRLFAYIVWTVPGGPAEKGGLQQGDKVLEWCGVSLVDRSFEEVCSVMDRTGDTADILVEHGNDLRMCDLLDEPLPGASRKNSGEALGLQLEGVDDKSPASPTRRKLPKTPEQLAREKAVSGRIQLQVGYNDEKSEVVMSVLAADDLAFRDDSGGFGNQPEAYVQFRLLPFMEGQNTVKTEVAEPTQNPIWNTTVEVGMVSGEQLMEKTVEVTLWDYRPDKEQVFLGECTVDIQKALLDDRPVWYRLEDPRQLRGSSSTRTSPRTSLVNELTQRLKKENRSLSEETQSDLEMESGSFLHPDHAYVAGSRRGSSQSEQLDVTEPYQLSKDFSRSLPGSRRSSFQSAQNAEKEADVPPPTYNKERRRSSCTQRMRDPDEILRSLKAVKGELLGRSLTISERRGSRNDKQ